MYVDKRLILFIPSVNIILYLNNALTNYLCFFKMIDVIRMILFVSSLWGSKTDRTTDEFHLEIFV
jgi:hypothetical protein